VLRLDLQIEAGVARQVRVNMGEPILEAALIPTTLSGPRVVDVPLPAVDGETGERLNRGWGIVSGMTCVSMGNPHAIIYCRDVAQIPLERVGPVLENDAIFPRRINVHFVQVHRPDEVTMRTWERGSGITLACGTGACGVCVAGVLTGRTERKIVAHLPGGDLELEWSEADNNVYMTGPAVEVFRGEWPDAPR
jgi:diaminopimelate epimerase